MKTKSLTMGLAIALSLAMTACSSTSNVASTDIDFAKTKKNVVTINKIKGKWVHPGLNYKWDFNEQHAFNNAQGTKGVWREKKGEIVALATNQHGNPSTWRFKLDPSGKTMRGTWSDPSGNEGQLTLIKQSVFDFSDISVATK